MSACSTTMSALFGISFMKPLVARFDQSQSSSDAGAVLLRPSTITWALPRRSLMRCPMRAAYVACSIRSSIWFASTCTPSPAGTRTATAPLACGMTQPSGCYRAAIRSLVHRSDPNRRSRGSRTGMRCLASHRARHHTPPAVDGMERPLSVERSTAEGQQVA